MKSLCFGLCDIAAAVGWRATIAIVTAAILFSVLVGAAYGWTHGLVSAATAAAAIAAYATPAEPIMTDAPGIEFHEYYDPIAHDRDAVEAIRRKLRAADDNHALDVQRARSLGAFRHGAEL